jgi:hypothetical protein
MLLAASAAAQSVRPERPYRGLFASSSSDTEQELALNGSLGSGYDDNILADAQGRTTSSVLPPAGSRNGMFGNSGLGLSYLLKREAITVEAAANSGVRYYPSLSAEQRFVPAEDARARVTAALTRNTTISGSAAVARRPYHLADMWAPTSALSGAPVPTEIDLPASFDFYRRYVGSASLHHRIGRRLTADADYAQNWGEAPEGLAFTSQRSGGGLTWGLSRGLALRTGYSYTHARYRGVGTPLEQHNIDAGVNYTRALSFSRRTTLSFSTGSAAVRHEQQTIYRATGSAELKHEIGRTWEASLAYNRGGRFTETWNGPLFSDVVAANVGGALTRRIQLSAGAGGAMRSLSGADDRGFQSYWGTVTASLAFNRYLNAGVNYLYTHHDFDRNIPVPSAWPQSGGRQRLTAHIGMWMPLFTQTRRPDAAR